MSEKSHPYLMPTLRVTMVIAICAYVGVLFTLSQVGRQVDALWGQINALHGQVRAAEMVADEANRRADLAEDVALMAEARVASLRHQVDEQAACDLSWAASVAEVLDEIRANVADKVFDAYVEGLNAWAAGWDAAIAEMVTAPEPCREPLHLTWTEGGDFEFRYVAPCHQLGCRFVW